MSGRGDLALVCGACRPLCGLGDLKSDRVRALTRTANTNAAASGSVSSKYAGGACRSGLLGAHFTAAV